MIISLVEKIVNIDGIAGNSFMVNLIKTGPLMANIDHLHKDNFSTVSDDLKYTYIISQWSNIIVNRHLHSFLIFTENLYEILSIKRLNPLVNSKQVSIS